MLFAWASLTHAIAVAVCESSEKACAVRCRAPCWCAAPSPLLLLAARSPSSYELIATALPAARPAQPPPHSAYRMELLRRAGSAELAQRPTARAAGKQRAGAGERRKRRRDRGAISLC